MTKSIIEKLEQIASEYNVSIGEIEDLINAEKIANRNNEIKKIARENQSLVGKCFMQEANRNRGLFPPMKRYFKVISERGSNEYRVSCLTFVEHPVYWFEYQAHKIEFAGDYYLGEYDFDSFTVVDILASTVRSSTEISQEEFNEAAKKYTEEMLDLDWPADHFRYGGKLPTDDGWKTKEPKEQK